MVTCFTKNYVQIIKTVLRSDSKTHLWMYKIPNKQIIIKFKLKLTGWKVPLDTAAEAIIVDE